MELRRRTLITVTPMAALMALAACSTDSSSSSKKSSVGGGGPTGGTLSYAVTEPDSLTPGRQLGAFDQVMCLFASLAYVTPDDELTYLQAESIESDDQQSWTIKLRDGWTFHNGEPVNAQAYVDAWNYTAYGPNAWENSGELVKIKGYSDLNPTKGKPSTKTMSGLKVVDDLTFTVELTGPDSQFPLQLTQAQTGFYPMPQAAYDDLDAYNRKPIGNGPFQMTGAWKDNTAYDVTAYADYPGTAPIVDKVTFTPYTDTETAYTDVLAGQADLTFCPASKMTSAPTDFGDRLYANPAPSIDYIGFPLWDDRYADKRVRQAISMAIDRDAVNTAIYGGLYEPATAFTPPSEMGTPEGVTSDFTTFDADGAKALLEEAGGFDGTIEFVYPGGYGYDDLYEAYANQVRQNLGVEATAKATTDWAEFYSQVSEKKVTGPHFGHWGALYSSQQNTLRNLYTAAGSGNAYTGFYSNSTVDQLLDQADAASTDDEVADFYKQVQEQLTEDFPVAPTFFSKYVYVASTDVVDLPAAIGAPVLDQARVTA